MTIRQVLLTLIEMLDKSHKDRDYALACYGSALEHIRWIEGVAKANNAYNMCGIQEKLWNGYRGFLDACGLLTQDRTADPYHEARADLSNLSSATLLGQNDLLDKGISSDLFGVK